MRPTTALSWLTPGVRAPVASDIGTAQSFNGRQSTHSTPASSQPHSADQLSSDQLLAQLRSVGSPLGTCLQLVPSQPEYKKQFSRGGRGDVSQSMAALLSPRPGKSAVRPHTCMPFKPGSILMPPLPGAANQPNGAAVAGAVGHMLLSPPPRPSTSQPHASPITHSLWQHEQRTPPPYPTSFSAPTAARQLPGSSSAASRQLPATSPEAPLHTSSKTSMHGKGPVVASVSASHHPGDQLLSCSLQGAGSATTGCASVSGSTRSHHTAVSGPTVADGSHQASCSQGGPGGMQRPGSSTSSRWSIAAVAPLVGGAKTANCRTGESVKYASIRQQMDQLLSETHPVEESMCDDQQWEAVPRFQRWGSVLDDDQASSIDIVSSAPHSPLRPSRPGAASSSPKPSPTQHFKQYKQQQLLGSTGANRKYLGPAHNRAGLKGVSTVHGAHGDRPAGTAGSVRQAAPMVLCVDNVLASTPYVLEREMEFMNLEQLERLRATLG